MNTVEIHAWCCLLDQNLSNVYRNSTLFLCKCVGEDLHIIAVKLVQNLHSCIMYYLLDFARRSFRHSLLLIFYCCGSCKHGEEFTVGLPFLCSVTRHFYIFCVLCCVVLCNGVFLLLI